MNLPASVALFAAVTLSATQAFGVTLGQTDNFNDGSLQNWASGDINPNPPVNVADVGQGGVGDHVMNVLSNAEGGGPGAQPVVFNTVQWTGDYLAAGITEITLDINNLSAIPIHPGLEVRGPGGNLFTLTGATVPANSGWVSVSISLDPSNFVGGNALLTLAGVTELRFREIQAGATVVPSAATSAYYDNITAAPEPASVALLGLGAAAMLRRCG
ncbi:MAG: PEP-CTERM sorting domain-containing protein [Phycisphaerales bacterium]